MKAMCFKPVCRINGRYCYRKIFLFFKGLPFPGSGFTLLEIMIALAIIGTALTVIIHTVNYHANVMYDNTITTQMFQLAKEKIFELETAPRNSKGDVGKTGFKYENRVYEIEDSDIIELVTVVKGDGKEVLLNKLVVGNSWKK